MTLKIKVNNIRKNQSIYGDVQDLEHFVWADVVAVHGRGGWVLYSSAACGALRS